MSSSLSESLREFVDGFNKENSGRVLDFYDMLAVCEKNDVSPTDFEKLLNVDSFRLKIKLEERKRMEHSLYRYVYQYNKADHKGLRLSIGRVRRCDTERMLWYVSLYYRDKRLITNFKVSDWEELILLEIEVSKHEIVESEETAVPNLEMLRSENKRLKYLKVCKICEDKDSNVVLLPCGHLCSCELCYQALKKCPICKKQIRGTVRVFLPY